jgi:hypothetical protein
MDRLVSGYNGGRVMAEGSAQENNRRVPALRGASASAAQTSAELDAGRSPIPPRRGTTPGNRRWAGAGRGAKEAKR